MLSPRVRVSRPAVVSASSPSPRVSASGEARPQHRSDPTSPRLEMFAALRAPPAELKAATGLKSAMKRWPGSSDRSPVQKSKRRVLFDLEQTEVRYLPREPSDAAQAPGGGSPARPDKAELAAFFQRQCASLKHGRERLQEQRERRLALSPSLAAAATPARGAGGPGPAGAAGETEPAAARGVAPSAIPPSMHLLLLKQQQQQLLLHSGQLERGSKLGFDKAAVAALAADEQPAAEGAVRRSRAGRTGAAGGGLAGPALGQHADFSSCSLPAHGHQAHGQRGALLGKLATDSLLVDRERRERLHNLRANGGVNGGGSGGRVGGRSAPALQDLPYILKTNGVPLDVSAPRRGPATGRENKSDAPRPVSCNGVNSATLLSARAIAATKAGAAPASSQGPAALGSPPARGVLSRCGPGSSPLSAGAAPGWQSARRGMQGAPGYLTLSRMPVKGQAATRELDGPGSPLGPQVKRAVSLSGETWPINVFKLQPIAC